MDIDWICIGYVLDILWDMNEDTIWLVAWNIVDFPYIGNFIIPTDELIFFRGVGEHHQPAMISMLARLNFS